MPLDPAYQTVARDDFPAIGDPPRDARRSPHYEENAAQAGKLFWTLEAADSIYLGAPWPAQEPILPFDFIIEHHTAVWDRFDERQRVEFTNESARWTISN